MIRLLSIAEFPYNNAKNANTDYTLLKLNCGYYSQVFLQKDVNFYSKSKTARKLLLEPKKLRLFIAKTFIMPKKFKNTLIIKVLSLKAIFLVIKFG